jgi:hypothetical protein
VLPAGEFTLWIQPSEAYSTNPTHFLPALLAGGIRRIVSDRGWRGFRADPGLPAQPNTMNQEQSPDYQPAPRPERQPTHTHEEMARAIIQGGLGAGKQADEAPSVVPSSPKPLQPKRGRY